MFAEFIADVRAFLAKVKGEVAFYFDVAVGVLAVGEIATGYISTLLGPTWGPRIAAGILLMNLIRTVAANRRKAREEIDPTDSAGA